MKDQRHEDGRVSIIVVLPSCLPDQQHTLQSLTGYGKTKEHY